MSLNKVLNRPMFRHKALRKGDLKPIQARVGRSVGGPGVMVGNPSPGISGVYNPNRVPMVVDQPSKLDRFKQGAKRFGKGAFRTVFGAPGYLFYETNEALKNVEGITPTQRYIASLGAGAFGFTPPGRVVAGGVLGLRALQLAGLGAEVIGEDIKKYRATPLSERKVLPDISGEASMDNFPDPATNEEIKEEVKISKNARPGSGLPGSRGGKNVQTDRLTEKDNESDVVQGEVDINKVVKNNDPNKSPVTIGGDDTVAEKGFREKPKADTGTGVTTKVETDEKANVNVVKAGTNDLDKPGKIKAADGTEVNNQVIDLARKYRKELMAGQKSQAKTVFLANLASGLLSGTTTKGGLGGALEVFGKALGPAVNNYATVKLKENEMENEFMSDALELAQDELAAKNDLLEGGSGLDFESTGYIQFRDKNGKAINRTGGLLKDGTYVMAALGQVDANGRQVYTPVPAGAFSKYFTSSFGEEEQGKTIRNLSGKYKALGIGKETIRILQEAAEKGETLGGPVGRFNLVTTRLGSALEDLGFSMFESKDAGMAKVNQMRESFKSELMTNQGMSEKDADAFLDKNFGSVDSQFKKTLKAMGVFKDETTAAELERLAINETVLTYALANSLKDKDRLTQKDIQMAKELVNVFPFFRGQGQVIRSLEAVNERILGDIEASELIYSEFGGDTATLENFRRKYGLLPGTEGQQIDVGFQNDSTIDLLEKFNKGFN